MRGLFTNYGVLLGVGLVLVLGALIAPYFLERQCKARWEPRFETAWKFGYGCFVRMGNVFVGEAQVILSDRPK